MHIYTLGLNNLVTYCVWVSMHLCLCALEPLSSVFRWVWGPFSAQSAAMEEPGEGPPVSSPDPAITSTSVEDPALVSNHAVAGMPDGSPTITTHTPQQVTCTSGSD